MLFTLVPTSLSSPLIYRYVTEKWHKRYKNAWKSALKLSPHSGKPVYLSYCEYYDHLQREKRSTKANNQAPGSGYEEVGQPASDAPRAAWCSGEPAAWYGALGSFNILCYIYVLVQHIWKLISLLGCLLAILKCVCVCCFFLLLNFAPNKWFKWNLMPQPYLLV